MADVALRPTFPKDELERLRQQRLTSLLQARDDPSTIAALAFSRVLYGPTHRFGTAADGHGRDVRRLHRRRSARRSTRSTYRPDNATLIVVGDVTPDKVVPLLEASFGSWKAPGGAVTPRQAARRSKQPAARTVYLVDKPGAPQSQIRIGWLGVPRSTPDYFPHPGAEHDARRRRSARG